MKYCNYSRYPRFNNWNDYIAAPLKLPKQGFHNSSRSSFHIIDEALILGLLSFTLMGDEIAYKVTAARLAEADTEIAISAQSGLGNTSRLLNRIKPMAPQ